MLKTRQTCRICGNAHLIPVISLGDQYVASYFANERFPALNRRIPLEVVRCDINKNENACGLVQLKHTVPSDFLYSSYGYRSGINETMTRHLQSMAKKVEELVQPRKGDLIVDIGANDGTLLKGYQGTQYRKVGFEPSNIAPPDSELPEGTAYLRTYFSEGAFTRKYPKEKAKIITSIAMFYDLESPHQFVGDIAALLHEDGCWVLELSYLPFMLKKNSYDTICHEHLEYYHLAPIEHLLSAHGLKVFDVETNDINGGSFRLYVGRQDSRWAERYTEAYYRMIRFRQAEFELQLDQEPVYEKFRKDSERVAQELNKLLADLDRQGKTVCGYGASTKGNVILQYSGMNPKLLKAIAERNESKYGVKTLGTDILISPEAEVRKLKPDYLLVLPWHFLDHFVEREREFLKSGGKFIVPLPEVRIVGI